MPDTSAISPVTVSLGGGLILDRDDFSMPPGAAVQLQNFEPSIQGGYRRLTGNSKFDSNQVDSSNAILGVKIFNDGVLAAAGNVVKFSTGTGWSTSIGTRTSAGRYKFDDFNNTTKVIMVDDVNQAATYDGSTYTLLNATGAPADPASVAVFKDHIFFAGMSTNPQEIVFSAPFNEADFRTRLISNIQKIAYNRQKTGLFLSGGFDSTFALSVVKDMDIDLTVYICAYDKTKGLYHDHDGFREESRLAAQTCKEWGVKHKILVLQQDQIYDYDRRWLNNARFPWSDRNRRVPRYFLCREAAKDGCKVILTGDSADELFSGYLHHHKYWLEGYCEEKLKYYKKAKWFPNIEFSDDKWNNMLISDLLITSEQNILATDQTCGMFGMESRPVYLGQNFVRYCYEFDGMTKFTQRFGWDTGTYKYLLREVMGDMLPTHVKERKKKTGWSSPWDNNHPRVQNEWRIADWQYMTELT